MLTCTQPLHSSTKGMRMCRRAASNVCELRWNSKAQLLLVLSYSGASAEQHLPSCQLIRAN